MNTSSKNAVAIVVSIILATSVVALSMQAPYFPPYSQYFEVPFEVVDSGEGYNYAARANFTITNASYWEDLWLILYSGHFPIPEIPVVNFTSELLIAVFQGERGSSGYSTNITRILVSSTHYLVLVDEVHPGENCFLLTVMTYPYQIVKISNDHSELPMSFIYNIITRDCV